MPEARAIVDHDRAPGSAATGAAQELPDIYDAGVARIRLGRESGSRPSRRRTGRDSRRGPPSAVAGVPVRTSTPSRCEFALAVVDEVEDLRACWCGGGDPELTAEEIRPLEQVHLVTGLGSDPSGLKAGGAAPGDEDATGLPAARMRVRPLMLAPGPRVDRAADQADRAAAVLDDTDAGPDLLLRALGAPSPPTRGRRAAPGRGR